MTDFITLFRHHLKLIFRQLWKNKTYTSINTIGLIIGLTGSIAIYSIIRYEYSFNNHIPDKDRIYRLYTSLSGELDGYNRGVSSAVVPYLKDNPQQEIESITRFMTKSMEAKTESNPDEGFGRVKLVMTDASYFRVFGQYEWLSGNPATALQSPFQVVLTLEQAEKYFGTLKPQEILGRQVIYRDSLKTTVAGIIKQTAGNTDFIFTDFLSFSTIDKSWLKKYSNTNDWQSTNSSSQAWVKTKQPLKRGENPEFLRNLNEHLANVSTHKDFKRVIRAKTLASLHFDQELSIFDSRGRAPADLVVLSILSIICIALLLMAMFNFINLATAQASGRAKEVGLNKVLGSNRINIFVKFILESLVITTIAALPALPIAHYSLQYFDEFLPNGMEINLFNGHYFLLLLVIVFIVGIFSGIYPAVRISGVSIGKALKANARMSFSERGTPAMRKILVSFQFVCSQVLIIAAISVFFQVRYLLNKDMGFTNDQIMSIYGHWTEPVEKTDLLYNELQKIPAITELTRQGDTPASPSYASNILTYFGKNDPIKQNVYRKSGDSSYLHFYDIKILAGRNVTPKEGLNEIIINETFLKNLGFNDPAEAVGEVVSDEDDIHFTIVGVMNDFHSMSLKTEIMPLMYYYESDIDGIAFKVTPEKTEEAIAEVTNAYRKIYPKHPATIYFMDETIRDFYEAEQKTSKLALATTILAILISGLGLFGLISISAIQRTKEVGIRKVLGAGIWSLVQVIAREFIWLILIALIISIPSAHYILQDWMAGFAYRISLGWWVYVLGGVLSIVLASVAIGYKVYRTVVSNPVDSLKYE